MIGKVRSAGLLLLLLALTGPGVAPAVQLHLTWHDNSHNETGFQIERWTERDGQFQFTPVATVGMNVTSYVDTPVADEIFYCYQVRAFNAAGVSAPSNVVCGLDTHILFP